MKYFAIATAVASTLLAFSACSGDPAEMDGEAGDTGSGGGETGGNGGGETGGTGGTETGGTGGTETGGMGGMVSCNPEEGLGGAAGSAGAAGAAGASSVDGPAIMGAYTDAFGSYYVTSTRIYNDFANGFIQTYDNDEEYIISLNDENNDFFPCMYARTDWTYADGDLYVCMSVFDAESVEDAMDADRPDDSDPATSGCGPYPWSMLTPQ